MMEAQHSTTPSESYHLVEEPLPLLIQYLCSVFIIGPVDCVAYIYFLVFQNTLTFTLNIFIYSMFYRWPGHCIYNTKSRRKFNFYAVVVC
jgi:hypothetical protein